MNFKRWEPDVVIITQVFYPDSQSTSQILLSLLQGFPDGMLKVTVVTGFPAGIQEKRVIEHQFIGDIEIRRRGIRVDYKRGIVFRAMHYVAFVIGASFEIWRLRKTNVIVAVTNPPFAPVWLWILSRLFVKKYQLILHDIYPEGLVALGKLREEGFWVRVWKRANTSAFQNADRIVVLGRDMAELLQSNYDVGEKRVTVIPNWSLIENSQSREANATSLYATLELDGKFIIQYSGNMGLWHDIDVIIRAAKILESARTIHFLLIGEGMRKAKSQELAFKLGIKNITWLPFCPVAMLSDSLSCCDVALISQRRGLNGVAVPSKLYGILSVGKPIIALVPMGCEVDRVISEENCGIAIHSNAPETLADAIVALEGDRSKLAIMGANSLKAFKNKYTVSHAVPKFLRAWGITSKC